MIPLRHLMGWLLRRGGCRDAPTAARFTLASGIVVDPVRHWIIRDGRTIPVEPRVMQLLVYLASRPGEILSKTELRDHVWRAHVVDEAIHRAVSLLRLSLGDNPKHSHILETVPHHGYRLLTAPRRGATVIGTRAPSGLVAGLLAIGTVAAILLLAPLDLHLSGSGATTDNVEPAGASAPNVRASGDSAPRAATIDTLASGAQRSDEGGKRVPPAKRKAGSRTVTTALAAASTEASAPGLPQAMDQGSIAPPAPVAQQSATPQLPVAAAPRPLRTAVAIAPPGVENSSVP